jgi:glycerate kinase
MIILVAPDKFKGSLSAEEVCNAIREGLLEVDPSLTVWCLPMADGGEGSAELLTSYSGGTMKQLQVRDPLFRMINASYGISKDGKTAFMEMAKASGLQLLREEERNPYVTSTVGTGDMIIDAMDHGVGSIMMGIGGSATNDGGMGVAEALGVKFYEASGQTLQPVGGNLGRIHTIDFAGLHPRLREVDFTIFCDVDNPLHGPQGAAYVFAPQKGADESMVRELDAGLAHYRQVLERATGVGVNFPGAGAGGGLPAALKAFARVSVQPGITFIIDFIKLEEKLQKADLVITGEGKIDCQTLSGKVVQGIADLAARYKKPVIAIGGKSELDASDLRLLGVTKLVTLTGVGTSESHAMENAFSLVKMRIQQAFRELKLY